MTFRIHLEGDELNEKLGGGIPSGSLVLIEGEYGAGKSVLIERMLYGFLKNGYRAALVSTERTTLHFVEQMHSLDYPVEEYLLDQRLLFLPVHPILGHRGARTDLLQRLLSARRMYAQDVVVIDAYSTILKRWLQAVAKQREVDELGAVEETLHHFKLLNARGKTIILTLEPAEVDSDVASILRSAADIYLNLRIESAGGTVSRSILVRRFGRADKPVADLVPFRVEPRAGFIVEIKSVS